MVDSDEVRRRADEILLPMIEAVMKQRGADSKEGLGLLIDPLIVGICEGVFVRHSTVVAGEPIGLWHGFAVAVIPLPDGPQPAQGVVLKSIAIAPLQQVVNQAYANAVCRIIGWLCGDEGATASLDAALDLAHHLRTRLN